MKPYKLFNPFHISHARLRFQPAFSRIIIDIIHFLLFRLFWSFDHVFDFACCTWIYTILLMLHWYVFLFIWFLIIFFRLSIKWCCCYGNISVILLIFKYSIYWFIDAILLSEQHLLSAVAYSCTGSYSFTLFHQQRKEKICGTLCLCVCFTVCLTVYCNVYLAVCLIP